MIRFNRTLGEVVQAGAQLASTRLDDWGQSPLTATGPQSRRRQRLSSLTILGRW